MSAPEQAMRAWAIARLGADAELAARVHGVFDGVPARATAPFVSVGVAEGSDWGTKDRPGREVRLAVTLHGVGDSLDEAAAALIEALAATLREQADGWAVVSRREVRTRFAFARDGAWRHEVIVRCRCLMGMVG
ncbi:MAG: DUF3168 domain-containing protein [Sphingomonadales bacterium]|nr:DUF3168 domain-containing protein [Sphingomonadales bacterium]